MNKLKKITCILSCALLIVPSIVFAAGKLPEQASNRKVEITINGEKKNIPEEMGSAYIDKESSRVMVPVRYISEQLGCIVQFLPQIGNQSAGFLVGYKGTVLKMNIGDKFATINKNNEQKTVELDAGALLYDERSYVPLRFISEAMGLDVNWNGDSEEGKVEIKGEMPIKKDKEETVNKDNTDKEEAMKEVNKLLENYVH